MKIAALLLLGIVTSTHGLEVSLDFETGDLTGWNTIGNVSVVDAGYGTSIHGGTYAALLTTGAGAVPVIEALEFIGLDPSTFGSYPETIMASAMVTSDFYTIGEASAWVKSLQTSDVGPFNHGWFIGYSASGGMGMSGIGSTTDHMLDSVTAFPYETDWGQPGVGNKEGALFRIALIAIGQGDYALMADDVLISDVIIDDGDGGIPAPDGGTTLAMLGLSVAGLTFIRRK